MTKLSLKKQLMNKKKNTYSFVNNKWFSLKITFQYVFFTSVQENSRRKNETGCHADILTKLKNFTF